MAAFKKGMELGADLVECDVHLSKDGHLIVMHDDSVDRTTDGKGLIRDLSLAELRKLDAGSGERIPTLEQLIAWVATQPQLGLVVELKRSGVAALPRLVADAIRKRGISKRTIVISFDPHQLQELKEYAPELASGLLYHKA